MPRTSLKLEGFKLDLQEEHRSRMPRVADAGGLWGLLPWVLRGLEELRLPSHAVSLSLERARVGHWGRQEDCRVDLCRDPPAFM